ncbi:MAG: ABC transporter permease [Rikenellaceae bacterium]|nr:ABC transporter permease [Rikenellaceae bacterium]
MVVVQFTKSVILIAFSFIIKKQLDYISHSIPQADNIIELDFGSEMNSEFTDRLYTVPYISAITTQNILHIGSVSGGDYSYNVLTVDPGFFDTYDLEFIEGGPFTRSSGNEDLIVNKIFYERYLLPESVMVGDSVKNEAFQNTSHRFIGIVDNFRIENLKTEMLPMIIRFKIPKDYSTLYIRLNPGTDIEEALEDIRSILSDFNSDHLETRKLTELYLVLHEDEIRMSKIIRFFTWFSLSLTIMGLFGLAWYSVERRRKEIAIRKIHGAAITEIITALCSEFMKWILTASVIGIPVSIYLANVWMRTFIYKERLSVGVFAMTILIVAATGIATVILQAYRAATANPVESIKTE